MKLINKKEIGFIEKTVADKIYEDLFNVKRTRYYGLRVGDKVIRDYDIGAGKDKTVYTVFQYGFSDNNCVYLKSPTGEIRMETAELCKIIKKVK